MSDPLPWTVVVDGARVRLIDEAGNVRATVAAGNGDLAFPTVRPLPDGWSGLLELPDGRSCAVTNGSKGGLRRHRRTSQAELGGTRWVYQHTTDRRATITRDGVVIAKLHRPWRWGSTRTAPGAPMRIDYTFTQRGQLDPYDEVMVTVFGVVLGPPGREGAFGQVGQGIAQIADAFS